MFGIDVKECCNSFDYKGTVMTMIQAMDLVMEDKSEVGSNCVSRKANKPTTYHRPSML
jgi:hypothetical protein